MSEIINPRDRLMQATPTRLLPITLPSNLVIPGLDQLEPNLDRPPAPTNFSAEGSLTHVNLLTGPPTFTQGHGYSRTNIYGAIWTGGPLPTLANAVPVFSYVGQVGSMPSQPATRWHLWASWVSRDGVESLPAGGLNGVVGVTGEDVERLVAAMTGPGKPFVVVNEPTVLSDGTAVPAGTYTSTAFMGRFVAGRGQIGLLAVDDARIASVSVNKLTAGSVQVGAYISSSNYIAGQAGFAMWGDGGAEFNTVTVRGGIVARYGSIGGNTITDGGIYSPNFQSGVSGWGLDYTGAAQFNSISLRGAIMGGAFQGYGWPGNGGGGFYLGPPGLLLGNAGLNRYVQITESGNIYTPGFSVENGQMTINQANVIKTLNIAGNAVTTSVSGSGSVMAQALIWVPAGEVMRISITGTCEMAVGVDLLIDGFVVAQTTAVTGTYWINETDGSNGQQVTFVNPAITMGIRDCFGGAGGRNVVLGVRAIPTDVGIASTRFTALGTLR